jgi:hypothetical protein
MGMMKTLITGLILAAGLAVSTSAQIVVRIGPPRAQVEHRPPSPGRDYVWVSGYQSWNGNSHQWAPGRWEHPPNRHNNHWEKHHWEKRNGGWVLIEGRWR